MEYTKRLISLPKDISDKLGASKNMSHTVVEALTLYWEHKSTVKGLAAKLSRIEQALQRIEGTTVAPTVAPTGGFSQVPKTWKQIYPHLTFNDDETMYWNATYNQWADVDNLSDTI